MSCPDYGMVFAELFPSRDHYLVVRQVVAMHKQRKAPERYSSTRVSSIERA